MRRRASMNRSSTSVTTLLLAPVRLIKPTTTTRVSGSITISDVPPTEPPAWDSRRRPSSRSRMNQPKP